MTKPIISVEGLSKSYVVGHQSDLGGRYAALRDTLSHSASALLRAGRDRLWGMRRRHQPQIDIFWALKDISFEVNRGDVVGIIGHNGAGKSTLLKILSRITDPSKGRITLRGRVASLLEVGTGFHPELTGRENIFLNGAILGMSRNEIRSKFDEIVSFAEIERFLDTPVKRYSSGMYVRLAFAVAAHLEPEILIVDEVLAVGDAHFQRKCLGKMSEVADGGRTVLFVSHNMNAIESLCSKGIVLESGSITAIGTPVRSVTEAYLQRFWDDSNSASWTNHHIQFDNPYFRPHEFALFTADCAQPVSTFGNDQEAYLEITGDVEVLDPALCVGYALYAEDGTEMYCSFHTDGCEPEWPPITTGRIRLRTKLPRHTLNEGRYRIELLAGLYFRKWFLEPKKNAPSITFAVRGGLSQSPYWTHRRPGCMAPICPWTRA